MQSATEQIIEAGLANKMFSEEDLGRLFSGTKARRYGLVNKALKAGELIRFRRGLYVLAKKYRTQKIINELKLANHIVPHSYVSLESALSYHGWIPEKVSSVLNVISSGSNKKFTTVVGDFEYYRVATKPFEFMTGVVRENTAQDAFLIASPLRALADYVYLRKPENINFDYLQNSLRIEKDKIDSITLENIEQMKNVFRAKRVIKFLNQLKKE